MNNLCLCYSKEKGLYVSQKDYVPDGDLLFCSYSHKSAPFYIPEENVKIIINGAVYLYANIIFDNNRYLLDFDRSKMNVLNRCKLTQFSVPKRDWSLLFDKIISGYQKIHNCAVSYDCDINEYLDILEKMLTSDAIRVKLNLNKEEDTVWDEYKLIVLRVGNLLSDLVENANNIILQGQIKERCILFTLNYLKIFSAHLSDFEPNDSRIKSSMVNIFVTLQKFLFDNNKQVEFMNACFRNTEN